MTVDVRVKMSLNDDRTVATLVLTIEEEWSVEGLIDALTSLTDHMIADGGFEDDEETH